MIQFTDVVKSYQQGNNALNGATLQVEDGEFCFLVGPSGSGKSKPELPGVSVPVRFA